MRIGKKYLIRWIDDLENEIVVVLKDIERGFLIFQKIEDKRIIVARPSSIRISDK